MERLLARVLISVGLLAIAAVSGIAAFGLFLTAVYLTLLPQGPPWLAPAITGGVALLVALVLVVLASRRRDGRRPSQSAVKGDIDPTLALGQELGEDVERWIQAHKTQAVMTALVAGFALGVSPRLRQTLRRLLGN